MRIINIDTRVLCVSPHTDKVYKKNKIKSRELYSESSSSDYVVRM